MACYSLFCLQTSRNARSATCLCALARTAVVCKCGSRDITRSSVERRDCCSLHTWIVDQGKTSVPKAEDNGGGGVLTSAAQGEVWVLLAEKWDRGVKLLPNFGYCLRPWFKEMMGNGKLRRCDFLSEFSRYRCSPLFDFTFLGGGKLYVSWFVAMIWQQVSKGFSVLLPEPPGGARTYRNKYSIWGMKSDSSRLWYEKNIYNVTVELQGLVGWRTIHEPTQSGRWPRFFWHKIGQQTRPLDSFFSARALQGKLRNSLHGRR